MATAPGITLNETAITALYFINKYRSLSIAQVAKIVDLRPKSVSEILLKMERQKLLGFFGNTGIRGYGSTPKIYYLTKTGHRVLIEEGEPLGLPITPYKQVNTTSKWSPQMYHRLETVDVLIALEVACMTLPEYQLPATLMEFRKEQRKGRWLGETTDWVELPATSENRIVPDAGFVLENKQTGKRALFLIEVDRGTERHLTRVPEAVPLSFRHKIEQYDRYLLSGRCKRRYEQYGEFDAFTLLVITNAADRLENMRQTLSDLPDNMHRFYRFSTLEKVLENFFHADWRGRSTNDQNQYQLIKRKS